MHRDAFGGIVPQTNLISFNAEYCHGDFVADHERLANASGEYQHRIAPLPEDSRLFQEAAAYPVAILNVRRIYASRVDTRHRTPVYKPVCSTPSINFAPFMRSPAESPLDRFPPLEV